MRTSLPNRFIGALGDGMGLGASLWLGIALPHVSSVELGVNLSLL